MEIQRLRCEKRLKFTLIKKLAAFPHEGCALHHSCGSNSFYQGKFLNALFPRSVGISIRPWFVE